MQGPVKLRSGKEISPSNEIMVGAASRLSLPPGPRQTFNNQGFRLGGRIAEGKADLYGIRRLTALGITAGEVGRCCDECYRCACLSDVRGRGRLITASDTVCEAGDGPRLRMTALAFAPCCKWSATARWRCCGESDALGVEIKLFRPTIFAVYLGNKRVAGAGLPSSHDVPYTYLALRFPSSLMLVWKTLFCLFSKKIP